ncbi:unnamed protein product [Rhizoctonia solani]|uniref:Uncharacterized protein n=1 Tax=Rhizoctonia solani TaxID=456999 RepID=A0A8H2WFQ3_9AGAM|nr:unnamed protein product [Rhizoctonia solani]
MMSSVLFDYIASVEPSFGDGTDANIGLMAIHYTTLMRMSAGNVRMEQALTSTGNPFARKFLRNMFLVRDLAFVLWFDMSLPYVYNENYSLPKEPKQLCHQYRANVQLCTGQQKVADAREELRNLSTFIRVALHEDKLQALDETYMGHRPAGYKPKPLGLGFGTEHTTSLVWASDLWVRTLPTRQT